MIGNMAVYTALSEPGDVIVSIAQPFGGHYGMPGKAS
jgi:glycine hydroxymethyltransferase